MPSSKIHRPQPIKSWTEKSNKAYDKSRESGAVSSPRGRYSRRNAIPVNATVGGEWELQACEELTTWVNNIQKKHKQRQITDLKKALADGITLVSLSQVLFNDEIDGIQNRPIIRAQRVENIHNCLQFLQSKGIEVGGVESQELADGNLRVGMLLMTRLQKRFENKHTTSGLSHSTSGSFHKSNGLDQTRTSGFQPFNREGSIHSNNSGSTNPGMLPDLGNSYDSSNYRQFMRATSISEKPETLLPGGAIGSEDEGIEAAPAPALKLNEMVSTTELDPGGVLQHKWGDPQNRESQDISLDIEMASMFLEADEVDGPTNFTCNGPGVQSSVEERLKSLLEMPNPGGYNDSGDVQEEGEVLELPPPDMNILAEGGDRSDNEDRLQAILEDPDNFGDYPQDWDRYVSDYVPSHAMEKKEGPRAQVMLEKAPSPPHQFQEPFFHGPPREHLGPSQGNPSQSQPVPDYSHKSYIQPLPSYLNQAGNMSGVVYSEQESHHSHSGQEGPPPNNGPHSERRLPTYRDHVQMRMGVMSSGSSGYDSRGPMSPGTSYPGPGQHEVPPPTSAYHNQPEAMQQQYYNVNQGGMDHRYLDVERGHLDNTYPQPRHPMEFENQHHPRRADGYPPSGMPPMDHHVPPQTLPSNYNYDRRPSWTLNRAGDPPHGGLPQWSDRRPSSSRSSSINRRHPPHGPPSNYTHHPPWPDRGVEESSDFTQDPTCYSGSSSRSNTPPLPAMSPPETPLGTPQLHRRCTSADIRGLGPSYSPTKGSRRSRGSTRSKRSSEKVKPPFLRSTSEPKIIVKRASGRRKNRRQSPDTKQTDRALPYLPLHRLTERSEDSCSETSAAYPKADKPHPRKVESSLRQEVDSGFPTARDDEIEKLRGQLLSLENMYKEMLKTVGAKKTNSMPKSTPRGARTYNVTKMGSKFKVNIHKLSAKQREKDVKAVNKRFSRIESHVVTLARNVTNVSSELRSQNVLIEEIDEIRRELEQLRSLQIQQGLSALRPMTVPLAANPVSVKKLTKFFGEEPPLLTLFLTEMGYDKYVSLFDEAGVGLQELPYLTEENLKQLGLPMGPRARILQETQLLV